MKNFKTPSLGRRILTESHAQESNDFSAIKNKQDIKDLKSEASQILKRMLIIIGDHAKSAEHLKIRLEPKDLHAIITTLRQHAKGEWIEHVVGERDEIRQHVLDSLFSELVEEPSSILFTTQTSPDSIRYEAMEASFWIECLNLLEKTISPEQR